ncbi:MAG: cytochrome b/b6 domain-containing protein [Acidobacteria bacterium]|nr:cytochrome b/b6 domain-containing protein [Acidobacteriota bacterium]
MVTKRLEQKHSFGKRWTHWVNFPVLFVMIWSGMLIYWANDVYEVNAGPVAFHFFPDAIYRTFNLDHRLSEGMAVHFLFMWLFAFNGLMYVLYTVISGEWRDLVPQKNSFRDALEVMLYDLGLRKQLPPQGKYNAAQRVTYSAIIVMGLGSLVTGLAIYRPIQVAWLTEGLGGYTWARLEHFALTLGYLGFFVIHIAQVVRAGWGNFQSMVTGVELVDNKLEAKEPVHE